MLGRLATAVGSAIDRLSPRERVLLSVLGLVGLGLACVLGVLLTNRSLGTLERQVESEGQDLRQLRLKAPELRDRLEARESVEEQTRSDIPALGTQLESHATAAGFGDALLEMVDQPEEIVGGWSRKSVQVRLRRQPLKKLAEFWASIVNDRTSYPVAITRLNVRRRRHEDASYDVEMVVSAYTPSRVPDASKSGSGGRATKAGAGAGPNRTKGTP